MAVQLAVQLHLHLQYNRSCTAVHLQYNCSTTEVQLAHCYISIGSTIGGHIRIAMAVQLAVQ